MNIVQKLNEKIKLFEATIGSEATKELKLVALEAIKTFIDHNGEGWLLDGWIALQEAKLNSQS